MGDGLLDVSEAHVLHITQDRHNQASRRRDGHGHVDVIAVHHIIAIDNGVDGRDLAKTLHGRIGEHRHEAQLHTVLLLELVLVHVAHLQDAGHVDLVVGGKHGSGVLRLLQTLSNALAHTRHRDTPINALALGFGGRGSSRRGRLGGRRSRRRRRRGRSLRGSRRRLGGLLGRGSTLSSRRVATGGTLEVLHEILANENGLTDLGVQLLDDTRIGSADLNSNLVGLNFAQDIVHLNLVSNSLVPRDDGALRDRITHGRNGDDGGLSTRDSKVAPLHPHLRPIVHRRHTACPAPISLGLGGQLPQDNGSAAAVDQSRHRGGGKAR
mmetsp:Transcript_27200/g.71675  ORF Transcript_27200/g.71675 Transcript_27200/m.71675 type:complete len:324 (+) Transcript_27200:397-1368(+)